MEKLVKVSAWVPLSRLNYLLGKTGLKKSELVNDCMICKEKQIDPSGIFEIETRLRDLWNTRIQHNEEIKTRLGTLKLESDDFLVYCINENLSLEELLRIQSTTKTPEKTEEIRSET